MPRQRSGRNARLVDRSREVNAEERKGRVGDRINERAAERGPALGQVVVLAAERDDAEPRVRSGETRDAVRVETAAIDHVWRFERAGVGRESNTVRSLLDLHHSGVRLNIADQICEACANAPEVDDAGVFHVNRGYAGAVRLEAAEVVGADPFAVHAVAASALEEIVQARQLALVDRHDDLPAPLPGNAVVVAELLHLPPAGDARLRLQRVGSVVDPGVEHAGIAAGLMLRHSAFFLQDEHTSASLGKLVCRAEAYDAAADDQYVIHWLTAA